MGNFFDRLKDVIDNVQQDNRENPEVKTAPNNLFGRLKENLANAKEARQERREEREGKGLLDALRQRIQDAKQKNQEDPNEDTADASVFEQLERELAQAMESGPMYGPAPEPEPMQGPEPEPTPQQPQQSDWQTNTPVQNIPTHTVDSIPTTPPAYQPPTEIPAGMNQIKAGGSIAMRIEPSMGASKIPMRIPPNAAVKLVSHNFQTPIILDGKEVAWCKVEFNGQEGWILDSYIAEG